MTAERLPMHGRNHLPGGSDPIPGSGGLTGSFRVTFTTPLLVDDTAHTIAPFDFVLWDGDSWFNTATFEYTATLDGIYRFGLIMQLGTASGGGGDDGRYTDPGFAGFQLVSNVGTMSEIDYPIVDVSFKSPEVGVPRPYAGSYFANGIIDVELVAGDLMTIDLFQVNAPSAFKLQMSGDWFGSYLGAIA